jgi:hypothetical protein
MSFTFTDGFEIGTLSLFCNKETGEDLHTLKINPVRAVRKVHGYYAQFGFEYFTFIPKGQRCYLPSIIKKVSA